jgi:indole-3-glycerol phosphate synthase
VEHKKIEVEAWKQSVAVSALQAKAVARTAPPPFATALKSAPIGLISEVKRRSPSAGAIREPVEPRQIASSYEKAGAQAVSVLMDRRFFGGGEEDFCAVRETIALPMLYKEFVVDRWQVWQAAALGASAILLIAAVLDVDKLTELRDCCVEARLEPLLEVHDEEDAAKARKAGIRCVGINNRDLRTFTVSLDATFRLMNEVGADKLIISESGIRSADDVKRLMDAGVQGILVGESLLRQPDVGMALGELMGKAWA